MFHRRFVALLLLVFLLTVSLRPTRSAQASPPLNEVPILLYHHIDSEYGRWHVTPAKLNSELSYLAIHDFHTISMEAYLNAREGRGTLPDNPVILTFDDGDRDVYDNAFPLLKKYQMVATFYIITGVVGSPDYVSWPQIRDMQQAGMEIGAHTVHHLMLTKLSGLRAFLEIWVSKLSLEFHLLTPITTFAYPDNDHSSHVADLVRLAGFQSAVIVSPYTGDDLIDALEIPRITIMPAEGYNTFAYEVSAGKLRATLARPR